jgi:hypothetical protein
MGMQTIYFKYDSFEIDSEGKQALSTNVEILKANPSVKIQVEGHCDQRGGIQYNIALGEKRANTVRDALKKAGISNDRLATISYGKERLVDTSMNEAAFAKKSSREFCHHFEIIDDLSNLGEIKKESFGNEPSSLFVFSSFSFGVLLISRSPDPTHV